MVLRGPNESAGGAIRLVRAIYMEDPDLYFYPDQYNNPASSKAHFEGAGAEIIEQTNGELTHFVAAMGTSGTFTGTTRRLRRDLPEVKCYSAQPSSGFHGLEGLKHMPTAIRPGFYDDTMADGNLWIETEDAYRMVRRLAREEGLLVGISSGCNVYAATLLAREIAARGESATIVTTRCDTAEKYLSENFWDQEFSLRYFPALSHRMVPMVADSPRAAISRASRVAAYTLQPEEIPTSSPSSRARRRTMR